jgi:hypothetical protein
MTFKVDSKAALDALHKVNLAEGYEGTILRHGLTPYQDDKRSSSLLKVKDMSDEEFTVIGVEEGTPYTQFDDDGTVVAVYQVPVWVFANPEGLTEETKTFKATAQGDLRQKHSQWEMRHTYMQRPATVQFFGRSKDGAPLLPVVLRWKEGL